MKKESKSLWIFWKNGGIDLKLFYQMMLVSSHKKNKNFVNFLQCSSLLFVKVCQYHPSMRTSNIFSINVINSHNYLWEAIQLYIYTFIHYTFHAFSTFIHFNMLSNHTYIYICTDIQFHICLINYLVIWMFKKWGN